MTSEQGVNRFSNREDPKVKISNNIIVDGKVFVRAISKNKNQNLFWAVIEMVNIVFYGVVFLILIKLVSRYMDGAIFMPRTFKLVSFFGLLLILTEIFEFVVGHINTHMVQHPHLETISTVNNKVYDFMRMELHFSNAFSISNVGIGIFILLLSQVLKEAVLVKQENELTI